MIQFDEKDYQELDIRAHKYETDKASSGHDYTRAYSILFNSFKDKLRFFFVQNGLKKLVKLT